MTAPLSHDQASPSVIGLPVVNGAAGLRTAGPAASGDDRIPLACPYCQAAAAVQWPDDEHYRCDDHAVAARIIDAPEPEVAGDETAPRRSLLLALWSVLVMSASAGLLIVSFGIIALHRFQGTLAPASALDGLRWGFIVFVGGLAMHTVCLIALRIREARL